MLKKTLTFEDLDGNKITEDFYFNLNKAEIAEMELSREGGLSEMLNRIIKSSDGGVILATFKEFLIKSVGRRSEDGRRFIKSQEIVDDFIQSNAYSELFMELATDAEASGAFIKAIIPADLAEQIDQKQDEEVVQGKVLESQEDNRPAWIREDREPTSKELQSMTKEQMVEVMQRKVKQAS